MSIRTQNIKNGIHISWLIISAILVMQSSAYAISNAKLIKKGNAFFDAGKYNEAIASYDEAAVNDPESPYIYYNKGTAFFKLEKFADARDAFQQAALKTKDSVLESKSKYNLGLCFYKEGERQKDSDLQKALSFYESSVLSFREALDLNPDFTEAAENMEMVRLIIKALLDEIKKQEAAAKKQAEQQQALKKQIQELVEQQESILEETRSLISQSETTTATSRSVSSDISEDIKDIAMSQDQLKQETETLASQLENQQPASATVPAPTNQPNQNHPAKPYLDTSVYEQESAIDELSQNNMDNAEISQQKSLDALNQALESMDASGKQQAGEQASDNQSSRQQKNQSQDGHEEAQQSKASSEKDRENQAAEAQEGQSGVSLSDDPDKY
jgi:Ca-activated chloride channel family protein